MNRHFQLYLTGAALSYVGTAIVPVALSFAVLDTGHRAGGLGLVLAAETIPTVAFLLIGGVVGDRRPRRTIIVAADVLRGLAQSLLAACLIAGSSSLALMVLASAVIGVGNAFSQPASAGFLAEIVAREQLGRANGLVRTANALAMVIGPALGGVLVVGAGPGWGIALDGLSYFVSALCLAAIRVDRRTAITETRSVAREIREGFSILRATRWLHMIVIQYGLLNMLAISPLYVIAPVLLSHTAQGPGAWGALLSSIGAGAILGALASTRRQPRRILIAVEFGAAVLALPLLSLAARAPFALTLVCGAVFGVGAALLSVLTMTVIQREIAPNLLSRTMSIVQLANSGLTPIGYLLASPVMSLIGGRTTLLISGVFVLLSAIALSCVCDIRRFGAPMVRQPA